MRAWIYDRLFHSLSKDWYSAILSALPNGARMLDVGVGTGSSLLSNASLVQDKNMRVEGIDINASYLKACQAKIDALGVGEHISVREWSVYDLDEGDQYDAVYFSASFMLLPDQGAALEVVKRCLKAGGHVCFTQTFETKRTRFWEVVKPLLYMFTSVHFGVVTYEQPFLELLASHGFEVTRNELLRTQGPREMRAIMATPKAVAVSEPTAG
jgi:ubiquinone/menaquinone biosynthesis C-methylase UbiE